MDARMEQQWFVIAHEELSGLEIGQLDEGSDPKHIEGELGNLRRCWPCFWVSWNIDDCSSFLVWVQVGKPGKKSRHLFSRAVH